MTKWIETTGRSEEDAIAAALFQLGLDRDDVSVEVIERAKTGFLGFGSSPAKVRVSYEVPDEESAAPAKKEAAKPESIRPAPDKTAPPKAAPVQRPNPPREKRRSAPGEEAKIQPQDEVIIASGQTQAGPAPEDDPMARHIREFLAGLMEHMEVKAAPTVFVTPEGGYKVILQGQGLGAIIGRRGETLDAIQQLTSYAVNRGQSKRVRIHIDAEGYRAKREESLRRLAVKMAGKVVKSRRNFTLEPMNAYERHVIHSALQDYPNITTYSTGTEPNRRTVVAYDPNKR